MKAPRPSRPSSGSSKPKTTSSSSAAKSSAKSSAKSAKSSPKSAAKSQRVPAAPRELRASTTVVSPADLSDKTPPPPATVAARAQRVRVNARRIQRELTPTLRGTSPLPQQMPDQIGAIMGPYLLS